MSERLVIEELADGWYLAKIGAREVLWFQMPPNLTIDDVDKIREQLLRLVVEQKHGPS